MNNIKKYARNVSSIILGIVTAFSLATQTFALKVPEVTQATSGNIIDLLKKIGDWLIILAGTLAVLFLIYGGIVYITGGPKAEESAKKIIMNSIIGLVIVALSYVITTIVSDALGLGF